MRAIMCGVALIACAAPADANDWQKFYRPVPSSATPIPSDTAPEVVQSEASPEEDTNDMWRKGFVALGYSSFNSPNDKTADAIRWGLKLHARFVILNTNLSSSHTAEMPLTLPTTTTSTTNGTVSVTGSGGYANGNYSGTTTQQGTQTTYFPITINRFDKVAVYYSAASPEGSGILARSMTSQEVSTFETQRGFAIRAIRDGSPAYEANLLPGDVITEVNGRPADFPTWHAAMMSDAPLKVHLFRHGQPREIVLAIPANQRPKS